LGKLGSRRGGVKPYPEAKILSTSPPGKMKMSATMTIKVGKVEVLMKV